MSLRRFMNIVENASNYIHAMIYGDHAEIVAMILPSEMQGRGFGRTIYQEWEANLPSTVTYVVLDPIDGGGGFSGGFWEKMGFSYMYEPSNDPDFEVPKTMIKGVNGEPTPTPKPYGGDDGDEY